MPKATFNMESVGEDTHLFKSKPLWMYWPGANTFYCGGRLMAGPHKSAIITYFVWATILSHTVLYFIFIAPYLWEDISPILPILSAFLNIFCYVMTAVVSLSDPGVLPRRSIVEVGAVLPEDYEALTNPNEGTRCYTCDIYRPPRSHHCRICDNCVELFDHHCDYINNCIGANNYKYFLTFLAALICMSLCDFCGLLLYITFQTGISHDSKVLFIVLIAIAVLVSLLVMVIVGFCCFHIWLSCKGKTTKEHLKSLEIDQQRAYCVSHRSKVRWDIMLSPADVDFIVNYSLREKSEQQPSHMSTTIG
mmetsp:Transcript_7578/g.14185  ORF Transcript_7578/g.14185 Transcript_7578/m.14185 type:complete len:306 (-) Transcript_7578:34-951(-)